jgi:hypothetical protein
LAKKARSSEIAAGLGYGRKHGAHYLYLSHWKPPPLSDEEVAAIRDEIPRIPRLPSASSIGYGPSHKNYYMNVSSRAPLDIIDDTSPTNRNFPMGSSIRISEAKARPETLPPSYFYLFATSLKHPLFIPNSLSATSATVPQFLSSTMSSTSSTDPK